MSNRIGGVALLIVIAVFLFTLATAPVWAQGPTPTAGNVGVTPTIVPPPSPVAAPAGGDASAGDLSIVGGAIALILSLVAGGAIARGLELIQAWRDWKPAEPNVKMIVVYGLTVALGAFLAWLQNYALPQYWQFVPPSIKAFILAAVMFVVSQHWHTNDKKAEVEGSAPPLPPVTSA